MERNELGNEGAAPGGQPEANEFSGSGATQQQAGSFDFTGTAGTTEQPHGLRDRAGNLVGDARHKLADVGSNVRERAGTARDKLVGALEAGAERLRERAHSGSGLAGATAGAAAGAGAGTAALETDTGSHRLSQVSDRVAGGMQATADFLRDADLDSMKTGIERQVREHPGRTLLIAVGLGYLIGRAFRGSNQ